MSFSSFDYKIIVSSVIFVVLMSFVGPAVGMTGDNINATDIPEMNVSQTRFDFVGDLPEFPSEPTSGVLNHSSDKFDDYRGSTQTELGTGDNGNRIFIVANPNDTVYLTDVEAGTENATAVFTANDQTKTLDAYGYTIDVHSIDISANAGKYEWIATQRADDSTLPFIGGALNLADSVAAGLAWLGSTFVILSLLIVEGAANTGGLIFDVASFLLSILNFILTNYLSFIDGAPTGWASAFSSIPGVVLSLQFGRVVLRLLKYAPGLG